MRMMNAAMSPSMTDKYRTKVWKSLQKQASPKKQERVLSTKELFEILSNR